MVVEPTRYDSIGITNLPEVVGCTRLYNGFYGIIIDAVKVGVRIQYTFSFIIVYVAICIIIWINILANTATQDTILK